jgi:hypothetical protein
MRSSLVVAVVVLGICSVVYSYHTGNLLSRAFVKPALSTAGNLKYDSNLYTSDHSIPRLEPGYRDKHTIESNVPVTISTFSLDWLRNAQGYSAVHQQGFVGRIFEKILNASFDRMRSTATSVLRKLGTLLVVVSSSLSRLSMPQMPPLLEQAAITAVSTVGAMVGVPSLATASAFKNYKDLTATQRLATTPLYFVCNSRGNAYLQDDCQAGNPDQKVIVYFMSSEDATEYLDEMSQANSQNANEFRVMSVSMEKIVNQIQAKKQSRKMGRYELDMLLRIQPSSRQCDNAEKLVQGPKGKPEEAAKKMEGVAIPMFTAKGLAIKRATGEVVTPFYFAYEDLKDDWAKMVANAPPKTVAAEPKVEVVDFTQVMCASAGMTGSSLRTIDSTKTPSKLEEASESAVPGIVPPRREIDMLKKYYRNQMGRNEFARAKLS